MSIVYGDFIAKKEDGSSSCIGKVVLGVWTSKKTRDRRQPVIDTWFKKHCTVWLSCCPLSQKDDGVDEADVIVTGGPDTYIGVTYRGIAGLSMMRKRFPTVEWFGILGDDNYVHWKSLLSGLDLLWTSAKTPIVGGEIDMVKRGPQTGVYRLMGGAGIFHNAAFADAFEPLIDNALADALGKSGPSRQEVHDVFFSRVVRENAHTIFGEHRSPSKIFTNMNFAHSTEPRPYIKGEQKHRAQSWPAHPPAVFHRFRIPQHMALIHAIATTGKPLHPSDRAKNGIFKRTRFLLHLKCSIGDIADALCEPWGHKENCNAF